MFAIAATSGRFKRHLVGCLSPSPRDRPREVMRVGLGCAAVSAVTTHGTAATACREKSGSIGSSLGAVRVQFGCFLTLCDFWTPLWVMLCVSELLTSR